ncbi:MAG: Type III restriction-modification system methylation subunit [Burkholderiaceae bacterium]|jgi:adenine-specific DNA-methyltransferase|nr:MAG: Type III restriction-modification system methylation subunit [Burkholderiaceae bacterium]
MSKQKLELTWIGKEKRPKLEPRILLEDPKKSYHAKQRVTENDIFDNRLIFGDNLLALKALEQEFTGKVKCIYIDPPFNTGAAFEHYDDAVEHSIWLGLMRDRLEIFKRLLTNDGVLFVHIDDKEMAYLKVVCDEVFGRSQFLNMIVAKTSDPSGHKTVNPSPYSQTEYVLMYAKDRTSYKYEQIYVESSYDSGYGKVVLNRNEHYTKWKIGGLNELVASSLGHENTRAARKAMGRMTFDAAVAGHALEHKDSVFQAVAISDAAGRSIVDAREQSKRSTDKVICVERDGYEDVYVLNGRQVYFYSSKVREIDGESVPAKPLTNLWTDIPWNGIASEGGVEFKNGKKPEKLIRRCLEIASNRGDWVLDSFAGSGTTGAVAHKMGRRWIMVELGEHCHTHIIPRLKKVIDGEDKGGVTENMGWQGGGGFRYHYLAPSLIVNDRWGNPVINPEYNAAQLAEALAKLEGFNYAPSEVRWWQHGHSSERDFIYVTTQNLSAEQLQALSEEVGSDRSLLVCCSAFRGVTAAQASQRWSNLTLKKIPKMVLARCEWGHDDYSLNVANLPMAKPEPEAPSPQPSPASGRGRKGKAVSGPDLFGDQEGAP